MNSISLLNYIRAELRLRIFTILNTTLVITLLVALVGCTSKPPMIPKPVENTWKIDAPVETLWKSSIEALVDKGVQVKILDKESGLIVIEENFDDASFSQYIADPYNFYGGQARINILFTKQNEGSTQVTIRPALFGLGRSPLPIKATSNGRMERDYYLLISGSLPKEKTYKWLEDAEPPKEEK